MKRDSTRAPIRALQSRLSLRIQFSYGILLFLLFFSTTAELWSNNRPLLLRYHGSFYAPVFQDLSAETFSQFDRAIPDFRKLFLKSSVSNPSASRDLVLWPLNQWSPFESNLELSRYPGAPSANNLLGTDDRGRDVFARLLYGARITIFFAIAVWLGCVALALLVGGLSGSQGGWTDILIQRFIEIFSSVPQFFVLLFLISLFAASLKVLILVSTGFGWVGLSLYIRAEVLKIKQLEFVEAARGFGATDWQILIRHLLPNSMGPVVTLAPFMIIANFSELLALDFLGLGLPAPTASWGELLVQGQRYMSSAWWLALFPALAILVVLLALSFVGEHWRSTASR